MGSWRKIVVNLNGKVSIVQGLVFAFNESDIVQTLEKVPNFRVPREPFLVMNDSSAGFRPLVRATPRRRNE